ncbi:MAG: radical SAM protein [Bryobacteraceae bacterium]|jgi:uncharacterized protein
MTPRLPPADELFVIPLDGSQYLIYAPLRRAALVVNAALVSYLRNGNQGVGSEEISPDVLAFLRGSGIIGGPAAEPPATRLSGPPRPLTATLLLTSACNLRCRYCYAASGDSPAAFMQPETAHRAIDFVAANAATAHAPSFEVNYHGSGEPTQHWTLLQESHLYAQRLAQAKGLRLRSSLTTNGVLDADQRAWITSHLDSATVSFDGLPEVQDSSRPRASGDGSSAAVLATLRAFDAAGFHYSIRMTVTAESMPLLPKSVAFVCRRFRPRAIQAEPVYRMGRGRDAASAETAAFIEAYRAARRTSAKAARLLRFSGARLGTLTNRFCGVAHDNFCVSPAGAASACHEVADERQPWADRFFYGRPSAADSGYDFDERVYTSLREQTVEHREFCRDCFAKWNCAGDCYHKSLHADSVEFAGAGRCEISRELTKDQLLENIAASGGVFWKYPGRRTRH